MPTTSRPRATGRPAATGSSSAAAASKSDTLGIEDPRFGDAFFSAGSYQPWVRFVTEVSVERGVGGTPAVLVAGVPVPANPRTSGTAVAA